MTPPEDHPVVIFDGVCNFCNASVTFIIRFDRKEKFRFAALQSEAAKNILGKYYELSGEKVPDSIILVYGPDVFFRSDAVLHVLNLMGGFWRVFYPLIFIPKFIRDNLYSFLARHRYKIFGRRMTCMIPDEKIRKRFL